MSPEANNERSIAQSAYAGRSAQMFPQLSAVQFARLSAHGRKLAIKKGDVLLDLFNRMWGKCDSFHNLNQMLAKFS
jgi:hypothetical protein